MNDYLTLYPSQDFPQPAEELFEWLAQAQNAVDKYVKENEHRINEATEALIAYGHSEFSLPFAEPEQ